MKTRPLEKLHGRKVIAFSYEIDSLGANFEGGASLGKV
jgi:hypothetical protein